MLEVLLPEATKNYCTNPSAGLDTTGWAALAGTTMTRTLERSRFGRASIHCVTPGGVPQEGAYYEVNIGLTNSPVCGSAYARGRGTVYCLLRSHTNSLQWVSKPVELNDEYWQRLWVVGTLGTAVETALRLGVATYRNHLADFYIDGAQLELKGYPTTYCDGDVEFELPVHDGSPYFEWEGQRHASRSTRTKSYRRGGRFVDLSSGVDVNLYPTEASGLGMPPLALGTQLYSGQERAVLQSVKALPRAVEVTFTARRTHDRDECDPQSLKELHKARSALVDAFKPDLVTKPQAGLIRYEDGPCPMDLEAIYESGMEWEGDLRDPTMNAFGVRLLAPDPYWHPDSQDVKKLSVNTVPTTGHAYLVARLAGVWQGFGSASFPIRVLKVHPNGDVYAGGDFLNIGGVACRHVARWDGTAWNILGGAGNDIDNGTVYAIAFAPDGDVYIGGTFTTVGAVTMNRLTRYQPDTNTFHKVKNTASPGVSADVFALATDKTGVCYIGGTFLSTVAGDNAYHIVKYNGPGLDTWTVIGTHSGLDGNVNALEVDLDGSTIFVGGDFVQEQTHLDNALPRICKYTAAGGFTAIAESGLNGPCKALKLGLDGKLYLGGTFSTAGFWTAARVAVWNRTDLYPLGGNGAGVAGGTGVFALDVDKKGNVYLGGDFTSATGDTLCSQVCSWNGTTFAHLDIAVGYAVYAIASKFEKLFLGYGGAVVSSIASVSVVRNNGKAAAYPILDVLGPLSLQYIENQDTGKVVRLNLGVETGERVLVDLRPGLLRAFSEWRGNVMYGLLPDSDFGDFYLLPGDNSIAFHGTGGSGSEEVSLRWPLSDWSFDSIR